MTAPYRVAIYAAPGTGTDPAGARLLAAAERWLGRATDGRAVEPAAPAGWTRAELDRITVDARRYGFHGTLKAPFRLAPGRTLAELDTAVERFAAERPPVRLPRLSLVDLDGFVALAPGGGALETASLAGEVVAEFDPFRAPLTAEELRRRAPQRLTARQCELLEQWGYPFVFDEFRFHLTLTDRLAPDERPRVVRLLHDWFAESLGWDLVLDALAVFVEATPGAPFRLHAAHPLRAAHETNTDETNTDETNTDETDTDETELREPVR